MTVKEALKEYYQTHYFGDEAFTARFVHIRLGPIRFPFPNIRQRREAIYLHDLTHLLTGYDTSWIGEGEIAAWELASGFTRKYWIGWIYPPMTFLIGIFIAPLRVMKAFKRGWKSSNLYKMDFPKAQIENMTLEELKKLLDL
jgi:hypothetical protein